MWILGAYILGWPYLYLTSLAASTGGYLTGAMVGSAPSRLLEPQGV